MNERTSLMAAAESGGLKSLKILLDRGADASSRDMLGSTAYDFAMNCQKTEAAKLLGGSASTSGRPKLSANA
jgi:ankyrin repeat protein